jgi:hypothetical protein
MDTTCFSNALDHKEQGNRLLDDGDVEGAVEAYLCGVQVIEEFSGGALSSDKLAGLAATLYSNM